MNVLGGRLEQLTMTPGDSLIQDGSVLRAANAIARRSEKQPDVEQLERTFVDLGVLAAIEGPNDQILLGRRGTGKSHVLQVVASRAAKQAGVHGLYIDLRRLGSASSVADSELPAAMVAMGLFRDIMGEIQYALLDLATSPGVKVGSGVFEALDELASLITDSSRVVSQVDVEITEESSKSVGDKVGATLSLNGAAVDASSSSGLSSAARSLERFTERIRQSVDFGGMARRLEGALNGLGLNTLTVVLDEWASVPPDVQPLLAEFIKHVLLPVPSVSVKIGSLEHRSVFSAESIRGASIGFELGGDIAADVDLDDFYVLDRAPDNVSAAFLELMYRHLDAALPEGFLVSRGVNTADKLRKELFTGPEAFAELVRAGEGVVRDFLNILGKAILLAMRRGHGKIDIRSVEDAAKEWFESDKAVGLTARQQDALRAIEEEVIGARKARSFMLERRASGHPVIQGLFDARLVHLTQRGYSDKENPGVRYNIYTLDYGTYVDLKRTKSQPELDLGEGFEVPDTEHIVPFDDKRSIRRVVLDPSTLDRFRD